MTYDILTKEEPVLKEEPISAEAVEIPSEPMEYPMEFTGNAGEYFRIWIVNTFLTIITFGIYAAWAKVRTRQYFYAHTRLAGQSFEYLANPKAILIGNLIIGGAFLLYTALGHYNPMLAVGIIILFYLFLPFLIYKTLRFYAHNSAFRNIRFRFLGSLKESYSIFMLIPIVVLIPPALGSAITIHYLKFSEMTIFFIAFIVTISMIIAAVVLPYWFFRQKKYFFDNFAFGSTTNSFNGKKGSFYAVYLKALLILIALQGCTGIIMSAFQVFLNSKYANKFIIFTYVLFMIILVVTQQYIYTRINNYCWEHSKLGTVYFKSTLKAREFIWLRVSNIIAIICSVGLLIPWAKVRGARYILDHLMVITQGSLDEFTGAATVEDSAVGEVATDIFDIEIGL